MGSGASMSAETELSTFKEMQAKFEALKAEGKTDDDIYAELKILYNTSATPSGDAPAVAPPASSNGDVEKPVVVPDAAAAAPEAAPPAGETAAEVAAPAAVVPAEGEAAPPVAAATPAAEGEAPVEAAATVE